jgi:hypothetical protein
MASTTPPVAIALSWLVFLLCCLLFVVLIGAFIVSLWRSKRDALSEVHDVVKEGIDSRAHVNDTTVFRTANPLATASGTAAAGVGVRARQWPNADVLLGSNDPPSGRPVSQRRSDDGASVVDTLAKTYRVAAQPYKIRYGGRSAHGSGGSGSR